MKVIIEGAYQESIWLKKMLSGLTKELKKKRFSFEQTKSIEQIQSDDAVFAVGMSASWMEKLVIHCNWMGIVPVILSNQRCPSLSGRYHFVGPDYYRTMAAIRSGCQAAGKSRIALYGIPKMAGADASQMEDFFQAVQDTGDIYMNSGNLELCFRSFLPYIERYEAVICMNGYAAVSLVKKLEAERPDALSDLLIISCEEILLSARYSKRISFVDMCMESYGSTAISILDIASANDSRMAIRIAVEGNIISVTQMEERDKPFLEETDEYLMFADPEEVCMARIEQLLQAADEVDNVIIELLKNNATYRQIADDCYMTEGNVKYRVKKYLNICKVDSKKELLDMLQEYLP